MIKSILTILFILFSQNVFAAISVDATSSGTSSGFTSSYSWNHTVGSGANTILVCGANDNSTSTPLTSLTYNGVAMTEITSFSSGYHPMMYFWLASPAQGTHSVTVNGNYQYGYFYGQCVSYVGVSQAQPSNFTSNSSGGSTTLTLTLTNSGNAWLSMFGLNNTGDALTPGPGTTTRVNGNVTSPMFDSNGALSAGSNSMTITGDGAGLTWGIMVELDPYVPPPQTTSVVQGNSIVRGNSVIN